MDSGEWWCGSRRNKKKLKTRRVFTLAPPFLLIPIPMNRKYQIEMYDSYHEPTEHWTDSCGTSDNRWEVSIEERMAEELFSYEDAVASYTSYMEEAPQEQAQLSGTGTDSGSGPFELLMEYLKTLGFRDFEVSFDNGTKWRGYVTDYNGIVFMTLPLLAGPSDAPTQYNGFNCFSNVLDLVNHFRFEEGLFDLDEEQDPLDFIYVVRGVRKSWSRLQREISNLSQ